MNIELLHDHALLAMKAGVYAKALRDIVASTPIEIGFYAKERASQALKKAHEEELNMMHQHFKRNCKIV